MPRAFLKNKPEVLRLHSLAEAYGQLPHVILRDSTALEIAFDTEVLRIGGRADVKAINSIIEALKRRG